MGSKEQARSASAETNLKRERGMMGKRADYIKFAPKSERLNRGKQKGLVGAKRWLRQNAKQIDAYPTKMLADNAEI